MMTDIKTKEVFFNKDTTLIIKGLALIMMMLHHFVFYPEWWLKGVGYPLARSLSPIMEAPSKLCVSIFCFITGYFYFFNKNKTVKHSLKKITDILVSYWFIFLILAIVAIISVDYKYNPVYFIAELFALKTPTMYFCWYVYFYIIFMLILPFLTKIMSKNIHFDLFLTLIVFDIIYRFIYMFDPFDSELNTIFINVLTDVHSWLPNVLFGYIVASYDLFHKLYQLNTKIFKNKIINIIIWILITIFIPLGRFYYPFLLIDIGGPFHFSITMDIIYSFLYIYSAACLCAEIDIKPIKYVLMQLGKYAMLMWFVSCIFFNNSKLVFQPILFLPKNEFIMLIWGIILCFIPSYIFNIVISKIRNYKNKIFFK